MINFFSKKNLLISEKYFFYGKNGTGKSTIENVLKKNIQINIISKFLMDMSFKIHLTNAKTTGKN